MLSIKYCDKQESGSNNSFPLSRVGPPSAIIGQAASRFLIIPFIPQLNKTLFCLGEHGRLTGRLRSRAKKLEKSPSFILYVWLRESIPFCSIYSFTFPLIVPSGNT